MLVPSTRTLMVKKSLDPTLTNAGIGALGGGLIGGGIGYFGADDDENAWARSARGAGYGALAGGALGGGATELGRWYGPRQEASRIVGRGVSAGMSPDSEVVAITKDKLIDEFRKLPRHEQLSMLTLPGSGTSPPFGRHGREGGEGFGAHLGNFMSMPGRLISGENPLTETPWDETTKSTYAEVKKELVRRALAGELTGT